MDIYLQVANQVSSDARQIFLDSASLNTSSVELADEVVMATGDVDVLQRAVEDDREAIATVTCTANETIVLAQSVWERISQINVCSRTMYVASRTTIRLGLGQGVVLGDPTPFTGRIRHHQTRRMKVCEPHK